jgi:hypothetical protein
MGLQKRSKRELGQGLQKRIELSVSRRIQPKTRRVGVGSEAQTDFLKVTPPATTQQIWWESHTK